MSRINEEQWGEFLAELNARNAAVQPPATPQDRVDVVAREIAKELMSNGFGDQGDRLAIRLGSQDFGGWSLDGAARQIRITLEQEGYVLDRMAEATRRAQLLASAPPAVWQPIETCPTGVKVWIGGGGCPEVHVNIRVDYGRNGKAFGGLGDAQQPTHWQPYVVPSPPTPGETR